MSFVYTITSNKPLTNAYSNFPEDSPLLKDFHTTPHFFQALPRKSPSLISKCATVLKGAAKLILFPVTLLFFSIQSLTIKIGVTGSTSKRRNQQNLNKLKEMGGEFVNIKTEDGAKLEGTYLTPKIPSANAKTILICSGSHQSHEFYTLPMIESLLEMGHNVMVFNYRGFGDSTDRCTENGIYLDTEAVYQYLIKEKHVNNDSLAVLGYSLGGGAATDLAAHHKIDLILDRTFSSMSDVAYDAARYEMRLGVLGGLLAKFLFKIGSHFNNVAKIKKVKGKFFVVSGSQDTTMKSHNFNKIIKAITTSKNKTTEELNANSELVAKTLDIPHLHYGKDSLWFGSNDVTEDTRADLARFLSQP